MEAGAATIGQGWFSFVILRLFTSIGGNRRVWQGMAGGLGAWARIAARVCTCRLAGEPRMAFVSVRRPLGVLRVLLDG